LSYSKRQADAEWFIERLYRSYRQAVLDMFVFLKPGGRLDVTKGPPLTSSEEHEYG
jgi:hypothetical protein